MDPPEFVHGEGRSAQEMTDQAKYASHQNATVNRSFWRNFHGFAVQHPPAPKRNPNDAAIEASTSRRPPRADLHAGTDLVWERASSHCSNKTRTTVTDYCACLAI